ncbi:MAG: GatB/YqeY domain-containing protein [Burkholderiales bacterium]|nr:GatB/YqeY domain-containing protein [Burkholderiales bacterium]OUT76580.1 MAG: glutamyl-tRNA amidotransferase [Betaproteobacteria bacterium TMED22]|tara:strand:+ start:835 stop:1278 length:444 start_codon:yes stop_codon:yes gene_type:complete
MSLKSQIEQDMRSALKARNATQLSTLRLLMAAMKQHEIDRRLDLAEADVLSIIEKMIKQRRESIRIFLEAERKELADKEQTELDVLVTYMPEQLTDAEVRKAVQDAIAKTNAEGPRDMGKVMGLLKSELSGKADFSSISGIVKESLS